MLHIGEDRNVILTQGDIIIIVALLINSRVGMGANKLEKDEEHLIKALGLSCGEYLFLTKNVEKLMEMLEPYES